MYGKELFPLLSHEDHKTQPMRSHYELAIMNIKDLIHIRNSKYFHSFGCGLAECMAGEQQFFPLQQASTLLEWSDEATGSTMLRTLKGQTKSLSDKGLTAKIYEKLIQLNTQKIHN